MVEWAKANPGEAVFGNGGAWGPSDLPWRLIVKETGIKTKNVPHDGGGPALIALLGGHIDMAGIFLISGLPHIKAGKIRALAVLDDKRHPALPDVPTAKEQGINVTYLMWRGILAPKATPRPIIEKLAAGFKQMTEDKSVKRMIKKFGDDLHYLGPDEFTKLWREEYEAHKELGKQFKK
jgi:tripartite-type tricarboxylate transporter receptor subunit TctC